jgi:hypothetical protein
MVLFCVCSYSQHPAIIVMGDHKEESVLEILFLIGENGS